MHGGTASAATPRPVSPSKLKALANEKELKDLPKMPEGNFTNPPVGVSGLLNGQMTTSSVVAEKRDHYKEGISRLEGRTSAAYIYDNGDGTKTALMYFDQKNTKDASGKYVPIDNELKQDSPDEVKNISGPLSVRFKKSDHTSELLSVEANNASVSLLPKKSDS